MTDFNTAKTKFIASLETDQNIFADTLSFVETWYDFTPCAFTNGKVKNSEDKNQGSCKTFALGQALDLTAEQTLQCFGEHYRDVCADPDGAAHGNIRSFMKNGPVGVSFTNFPLTEKF